jgi:hypothetical protein
MKIEQTMQAVPEPEPVKIEPIKSADQTQPKPIQKSNSRSKSRKSSAVGATA